MPFSEAELMSFINVRFSDNLLQVLYDTVDANGMLKGAMTDGDADFFEKLFLLRELRLLNALSGKDYSYSDILIQLTHRNDAEAKGGCSAKRIKKRRYMMKYMIE